MASVRGANAALRTAIADHIAATQAETKGGSPTWMLAAMGWPDTPGNVLGYGTIIGTGNAVVQWTRDARGDGRD